MAQVGGGVHGGAAAPMCSSEHFCVCPVAAQSGPDARVIRELASDLTLQNFRRSFDALCTSLSQSQLNNRQLVGEVRFAGATRRTAKTSTMGRGNSCGFSASLLSCLMR